MDFRAVSIVSYRPRHAFQIEMYLSVLQTHQYTDNFLIHISSEMKVTCLFCRRIAHVVVAFIAVYATAASAQNPYDPSYGPYSGKLAGKDIVAYFGLGDQSGTLMGTYFYRDIGRDIALYPVEGKPGTFKECPPTWGEAPCDKATGYWTIQLKPDQVQGQWRKTLSSSPVNLQLAKVPDEPPAFAKHLADSKTTPELIDRLRAEGPALVGKEQSAGNVRWHVVTDKRSGIKMPFLTATPNQAAMEQINAELTRTFINYVAEALYNVSRDGDSEAENKVYFANDRYFAVGGGAGGYGGGAHPYFGFSVATYDLNTGKRVDFTKLYRIAGHKGKPTDLKTNNNLLAQALRQRPKKKSADTNEEDCWQNIEDSYHCDDTMCEGEINPETWGIFPTPKGLAVIPDVFAEVVRHCRADYRVLPWDQANKALISPVKMP